MNNWGSDILGSDISGRADREREGGGLTDAASGGGQVLGDRVLDDTQQLVGTVAGADAQLLQQLDCMRTQAVWQSEEEEYGKRTKLYQS